MSRGPDRGKSGKNGKGGNAIGNTDGKEFAVFEMFCHCQAGAERSIARIEATSYPSMNPHHVVPLYAPAHLIMKPNFNIVKGGRGEQDRGGTRAG